MLETEISKPADYSALAAAAGLWLDHFRHLFAAQFSETPGDYMRRIPLDAAATRLRWT